MAARAGANRSPFPGSGIRFPAMKLTASTPRIAFETHGQGSERTPVILIMGLGMRGEVWKPQVDDLVSQHEVATFDHRGVGESDAAPTRTWTMRDMAEDALRVMDELGWERAHVGGVSLGGMIAQEVALQAPGRLKSLTLIATQPGGKLGWVPPPRGAYNFVRSFTSGKSRLEALRDLLYPADFVASLPPGAMDEQLQVRFGRPAPLPTVLGQLSAVARHDTRARLRSLRIPTLVVRPGRDILIHPRRSDAIHRAIPSATLYRLDDAGHGVTYQSAAALNARLLEHFAEAEARTSPN